MREIPNEPRFRWEWTPGQTTDPHQLAGAERFEILVADRQVIEVVAGAILAQAFDVTERAYWRLAFEVSARPS